jgi:hypothetical protein
LTSFFHGDKANDSTEKMFGSGPDGHSCLFLWTGRKNPEGRHGKPRVFWPKVNNLPADALTFSINGETLETAEELETLAKKLEQQWTDEVEPQPEQHKAAPESKGKARSHGTKSPPPPSASHPVTSTVAEPTTSPQTGKETPPPKPKRRRKRVRRRSVEKAPTQLPPRGNRSLADWFRGLSLREITRYINAAASAPNGNEMGAIKEVLEPECINVIAEKLALADYQDYFDFYANPYGQVPDQLKCAASEVIVSDSELRRSWVGNMEKGKAPDRIGVWLGHISRFYPNEFLERMDKLLTVDILFGPGRKSIEDLGLFYITGMIWFCRTLGLECSATALSNSCLDGNFDFLRNALQGPHDQSELLFFWKETRKSMSDDTRKRVKTFFRQVLRARVEKAPGKYKCFPPTAYDQAFVNIDRLLRAEHFIQ